MNKTPDSSTANAKTNKPVKPELATDAAIDNGIGQIRQILVGEFISSWESRISKMEKGVKELIQRTEAKLSEFDERISTLDKEVKDELETNLMDLEQENEDLRSLLEKFKEEFEESVKNLEKNKLDRSSIADVFIQWGQKVKG